MHAAESCDRAGGDFLGDRIDFGSDCIDFGSDSIDFGAGGRKVV